MSITRKTLADTIDSYDDEIAELQASKRETFQSYREQLSDLMGKDEVKAEIEATKAAIKRRRAIREKGEEVIEQKDALADEIFDEITAANAPRATRVENIEQFAIKPQAQPVQTVPVSGSLSSNAGTEAVEAPAINSEIPSAEAEEAGEEVVTAASSPDTQSEPAEGFPTPTSAELGDRRTEASPVATVVPSNVTSIRSHNPATHFLNADGLARLHGCLKPELCGSGQPRVKLCFNCSVKHDGPTPQVEGGAA